MQIQRITPKFYFNHQIQNTINTEKNPQNTYSTNPLNITFEARVDKGLQRFYEINAERMPKTVKKYIESLPDKSLQTPLQAQAKAFAALAGITTIAEVKENFADEELFSDLKDIDESKATRGLLSIYRENKELLALCDQSILANKENFTVWLLKEIFLKGHTLEEINKNFYREADKDFMELYKTKENNEEEPIRHSTIKALGIKLPEFEYQQSLRYTREGYSDLVGEKISYSLKEFINSLPIEERTARARKSVQKFENWWNSMSRDQKLDIIAFQEDELEMLSKFNSSEYGKTRGIKKIQNNENSSKNEKREGVKVDSSLSRDDLFKIWAGNNLKIFEANLTEYDKIRIETKREQRRAEWWNSMSEVERTEYIEKLRVAAEPLKYAMIDAWNNNIDILIELSHTLTKHHFNKPTEILYGTTPFNKYFSQVMSDFWKSNPDFAKRIGVAIKNSHEKIKESMSGGRFELLKQDITKSKIRREKEVSEAIKNYREVLPEEVYYNYPEHVQRFIDAYKNCTTADLKTLPIAYVKDFFDLVEKELSKEQVESWMKFLNNDVLDFDDRINIKDISNNESPLACKIDRALEATLADALFECTSDPNVYLLSQGDCKFAMKQIIDGWDEIKLFSQKNNKTFIIPVLNRNIDVKKIDELYNSYIEPLSENDADGIVDQLFTLNYKLIKDGQQEDDLIDILKYYVCLYGNSLKIPFASNNTHTAESRAKFMEKFINNLPADLDKNLFKLNIKSVADFNKEEYIEKIDEKIKKKYYFLPKSALYLYIYELNKNLRGVSQFEIEDFERLCCKPKKSHKDYNRAIVLNRYFFSAPHKLYSLVLEQALADVIYDATGEEKVYALKMEEMIDNIENFLLVKKINPSETWQISSSTLGENFDIRLKKRIQPYQIEHKFKEYKEELDNCLLEIVKENGHLEKEDILYVLNPDETRENIDKYTLKRIDNIRHFN